MITEGLVLINFRCDHVQPYESTAWMSLLFCDMVTLVLKVSGIEAKVGSSLNHGGGFHTAALVPDVGRALQVLTEYFSQKPWDIMVQIGWWDQAEFYVRDHYPRSPDRPLAQILTDLPTLDPKYEHE